MFDFSFATLMKASIETVYMVGIASLISISVGLALGAVLFRTGEKTYFHRSLAAMVNVTRSLPFIILMISVIPLTRLLVGTSIGTNAAIVPLALAAIPFYTRIAENALREVPQGLIEAAHAMGASVWDIMTKVMIPEALPSLIRGGSLTVIALIGYSAMAGVVGGGGLGELAINYGYQRFNVGVMVATVVMMVLMVEIVQRLGDYAAHKRELWPLGAGAIGAMGICLVHGALVLIPPLMTKQPVLRVGVMSGWPQAVMKVASVVAEKDYHLKLEVIPFNDYVQPNIALANRSIDANIFQHIPYLDAQLAAHHFAIKSVGKTFVYPMGFYSRKVRAIQDLKQGATIAIPNDPSNGGRALMMLQKAHLITINPKAGILASVNDITQNPHHFQFKQLDAAQLPRALQDADLVAVTNDFIIPSGLNFADALLKEGKDSPYANIIVARSADQQAPAIQSLVKVMHSPAVVSETDRLFPHGAAIPAW